MQHPAAGAGAGTTDPFLALGYDHDEDAITIRSTREKVPLRLSSIAGKHALRLTAAEAELLLALVLSARLFGGEAERTLLAKLGDFMRQF
jgi:hypothetical protein